MKKLKQKITQTIAQDSGQKTAVNRAQQMIQIRTLDK